MLQRVVPKAHQNPVVGQSALCMNPLVYLWAPLEIHMNWSINETIIILIKVAG